MTTDSEVLGLVFDVDHFAIHDGPGIRTSIYLKGCTMHCAWCHSPESQSSGRQLLFAPSRCVNCFACTAACPNGLHTDKDGKHIFEERKKCVLCGGCTKTCPSGALFISGEIRSSKDVADEALEDAVFYRNSGGGVTLSGGEVLNQPEFALDILRRIKRESVHTIVETAGYGDRQALLDMAKYTDIFYFDYKLVNAAALMKYTGAELSVVRANLEALREKSGNIVLRVPLIPGITDTMENLTGIVAVAEQLRIGTVHFLPYNPSSAAKYEWCGRKYALEGIQADDAIALDKLYELGTQNVSVQVIR